MSSGSASRGPAYPTIPHTSGQRFHRLGGERLDDPLRGRVVARLDGDPQYRLGARRAHDEPARRAKLALGVTDRHAERWDFFPLAAAGSFHVLRDLRPALDLAGESGERLSLETHQ